MMGSELRHRTPGKREKTQRGEQRRGEKMMTGEEPPGIRLSNKYSHVQRGGHDGEWGEGELVGPLIPNTLSILR